MIDLSKIPGLAQRQDSLTDQLEDLVRVAERLGMYDAADYLSRKVSTAGSWEEALGDGRFGESLREGLRTGMGPWIVGFEGDTDLVVVSSVHKSEELALERARKESSDALTRRTRACITMGSFAPDPPAREFKAYRVLNGQKPRLGVSMHVGELQGVVK